jgi:hypothetical protein
LAEEIMGLLFYFLGFCNNIRKTPPLASPLNIERAMGDIVQNIGYLLKLIFLGWELVLKKLKQSSSLSRLLYDLPSSAGY